MNSKLRAVLAATVVLVLIVLLVTLHFLWDSFSIQLGTVGEWLTAIALVIGAYELFVEHGARRSDREFRDREELHRRRSVVSGLLSQARSIERAVGVAHKEFIEWLRKKDVLFDEVIEGAASPGETLETWQEAYADSYELLQQMRTDSAVDLPAVTIHVDAIHKAISLESVVQNELRTYCQQHNGLTEDDQLRTSTAVEFAEERYGTAISPAVHVLLTSLGRSMDEIRGQSIGVST